MVCTLLPFLFLSFGGAGTKKGGEGGGWLCLLVDVVRFLAILSASLSLCLCIFLCLLYPPLVSSPFGIQSLVLFP